MRWRRRPRVPIPYRDATWRPRTLVALPLGGGWVALHPPREGVILLAPLHVGRLRGLLRAAVLASAAHDPEHWAQQAAERGPEYWDPEDGDEPSPTPGRSRSRPRRDIVVRRR